MLNQPYLEKALLPFHAIVGHFLVNGAEEKMTK